MTTKPCPRHGVTVQNGSELIALSAVKPLEASLRDGSRGGVMVWKLGIGNFRSGLVDGVEFPQTNFQISSKTKFQGPNKAEPLTGLKARQHEAQGFSPVLAERCQVILMPHDARTALFSEWLIGGF